MTVKSAADGVRVHLRVSGQVQGVFYRASTQEEAERLGLVGWVRNAPDGSVEVEAEGPPQRVQELIAWCRQGPPAARVQDVEVTELAPTGEDRAFRIA